jgi:Tol biopolymer transport system component
MFRARFLIPLLAPIALSGCGDSAKTVSPGGGDTGGTHLVVYASDRGTTAGQFDIYLYDLDALGFRLIRNISDPAVADVNPTISSDGLVIAFESNRGGTGATDILLYSRYQQQLISLPGVNTSADELEPAFTGDALKMAFVRMAAGIKNIHLVDGLGDTLVPLTGLDTTATVNDWSPSPDQTGALIAFTSDRNGNPDVFVWDASKKAVLDLPDLVSPGNDIEPSLTPDGHFICFASDRAGGAGGYDLYFYDLQLKAFVTLPANVNTSSNERNPALSRSGDVIVFESDRAGVGKIDLWNCQRSTVTVGQGTQESSAGDDIDPSLLYP